MTDSEGFSSTMVLQSGTDKAEVRNLPAPVMQALYHQITGKRERISRQYDGDFIIDHPAIEQLIEKLSQTLDQFNNKAYNISIDVFHYRKDRITHSSVPRFRLYDTQRADPVSAIAINITFLVAAPTVGEYQSYEIQINMNSYNVMKDDKFAFYSGRGKRYSEEAIEFSIQYVDYVIARSFKSTMDEWVDSLDKMKIVKVPNFIYNYDYRISNYIAIPAVCGLALIYNYFFMSQITTTTILIALGALALCWKILADLAEFALRIIGGYGTFPFILLNRGDARNQEVFIRRRSRAFRFAVFVLSVCILPIIAGIASSLLFENFFK